MSVPGPSGSKVFFTMMGMPFDTTGCMVGGYTTRAPKCEISSASLYDMFSMVRAWGTIRGSAVIIPFTSVQIQSMRAFAATASNEAV